MPRSRLFLWIPGMLPILLYQNIRIGCVIAVYSLGLTSRCSTRTSLTAAHICALHFDGKGISVVVCGDGYDVTFLNIGEFDGLTLGIITVRSTTLVAAWGLIVSVISV